MSMNFSTAEELDRSKDKVRKERTLKLTKDRRNHNGNNGLAQTDGLRVIQTKNKRRQTVVIDDQEFDLTRIRKAGDLLSEDDIAEQEGWYND